MPALRETMGVATALERRVAVTSQEAPSAVTPRIPGKSGRSGTTNLYISATSVPLTGRTAVIAHGDGRRRGSGTEEGGMGCLQGCGEG